MRETKKSDFSVFDKYKLIVIIPIIIFTLLRIPSLFESFWYGDEAIYAAVAQEMANGKLLYAETWDHKPPFILFFFYPAALIGWELGFPLLRFAGLTLGVLTLIFVNGILKKKVGDVSRFIGLLFLSITLGSTIFEGNVVNAEIIFITFNSLVFLLLMVRKHFMLAGFLAFLSLTTKVPGFVELAYIFALFAFVFFRSDGLKFVVAKYIRVAIGFTVPFVLMILYFRVNGTFPDFLYANVHFNRLYSLHEGNFLNVLGRQVTATVVQAASILGIFAFTTILWTKKRMSNFTYLAVNLFAVQFFATLLSAKNYSHYFIQMLTGFTLLLAIFIDKLKIAVKPANLLFTFATLVIMSPLIYSLKLGGSLPVYAPPLRYYSTFVNGYVLGDLDEKERFWWGSGQGVHEIKDLAKHLGNSHLEYENVYFYSSRPWIMALSERRFTNKFVVWFHLSYRTEHLLEDLKNIRVSDMVVVDADTRMLGEVLAEIEQNFDMFDEYGKLTYYRRVDK